MLKTTIVLISHQSRAEVRAMCGMWQRLHPEARIHVAYGGTAENFSTLDWPDRTWIPDPRLRTRDHQRERQSYQGVMRGVSQALAGSGTQRILMVECDVVPLREGLIDYLTSREQEEKAQVLGTRVLRVDGTSHPHYLAHQSHPLFQQWLDQSIRPEKETVMMMMGCLTWWTWEAFAAVAAAPEPMPVYLELAMPTTAHHLGYRVRSLPELDDSLEPLGEVSGKLAQWRSEGRRVAHPCKHMWKSVSEVP